MLIAPTLAALTALSSSSTNPGAPGPQVEPLLPAPSAPDALPPRVEPLPTIALEPWLESANLEMLGLQEPATAGKEPKEGPARYENLYRRFSISLGAAAYTNFQSTAQVSGGAGVGAVLDFEDLLSIDTESTVARLDLHYAFNDRHRIDAAYYDISRSGSSAATQQDINFGDITIPAGSQVDSSFDTRIIKLAYRYNFVADERTAVGASFGIHSMGLDVALESAGLAVEESFKQELPMPLLGLHFDYALSHTWLLRLGTEFLKVDLGDFRGLIADNRVTLEHSPFEHFGWGIGFNGFRLDAHAEDGGLEADVDYSYQGLMLYLRFY